MNIYEEIQNESMNLLLESLIKGTSEGKRKWDDLEYLPISFMQTDNVDDIENKEAVITQSFELTTNINGIEYELELTEEINFPLEKGDIVGSISFEGENGYTKHDFGLSFDIDNYMDCRASDIGALYRDSTAVRLAEAVVSLFKNSDAVDSGFSYARFFNEKSINPKWKRNKTVKLCNKLMDDGRMEDFHRIVLDIDYRNQLLEKL